MEQTSLISINRSTFSPEAHAIDHGAIIYSHMGSASVRINFDTWELNGESVLCFFPGDIIKWETMSDNFTADAILYIPMNNFVGNLSSKLSLSNKESACSKF